jgi:hypothetical protein
MNLDSMNATPEGVAVLEAQLTKKYETERRIRRIILLLTSRDEFCKSILRADS